MLQLDLLILAESLELENSDLAVIRVEQDQVQVVLDLDLEYLSCEANVSSLDLTQTPVLLPAQQDVVTSVPDQQNVHLKRLVQKQELSVPLICLLGLFVLLTVFFLRLALRLAHCQRKVNSMLFTLVLQ